MTFVADPSIVGGDKVLGMLRDLQDQDETALVSRDE
jgi:hypothetical protein